MASTIYVMPGFLAILQEPSRAEMQDVDAFVSNPVSKGRLALLKTLQKRDKLPSFTQLLFEGQDSPETKVLIDPNL